jgi:hypothetical protein
MARRHSRRHRSPSVWWRDFKKTDRYRLVSFIVRNTIRISRVVVNQPGINGKLRDGLVRARTQAGAAYTASARHGHRRGSDLADYLQLKQGVMTDSEWEDFQKTVQNRPDGVSYTDAYAVWLDLALDDRRSRRPSRISSKKDRISAEGLIRASLPGVSAGAPSPSAGFSVPAPSRVPTAPVAVPVRRPATRQVNRTAQRSAAWDARFDLIKEYAMANGELKQALDVLRRFVEVQPRDRVELHERLAELAAFAEALGPITEEFKATLHRQRPDGSPGVPAVVTQHLTPISEHGAQIGRCCADTAHSFEDVFAEAIKAADDNVTPSSDFLRTRPAG